MLEENKTIASQLDQTQEITADSLTEGSERRRFSRRAARWRISLTTMNKDVIHCRTQDVSERGASVDSHVNFRANTKVLLDINTFYNGTKRDFKILAEVKHTSIAKDGFTLGLFFKDASADTFDFFRKYSEGLI